MNADGRTPCEHNHGRNAYERQVEFGEGVFYYIPKRLRSKLDNRWRLGVYLGIAMSSNENFVCASNGSVTKSRSLVRVVSASRWGAKLVLGVKGIPGKHNPTGADESDAGIEDFQDPTYMVTRKVEQPPKMSYKTHLKLEQILWRRIYELHRNIAAYMVSLQVSPDALTCRPRGQIPTRTTTMSADSVSTWLDKRTRIPSF